MANPINEGFEQVRRALEGNDPGAADDALRALDRLLDQQESDDASMAAGQFPKDFGGGTGDLNMALFNLPNLIAIRESGGHRMPDDLRARLDEAVRLAIVAARRRWDEEIFDRRRDHKAYTNIFLLYIRAFLLGGRHRNEERLVRAGLAQWKRWLSHVAYTGIDEFVSDYYNVDYEALLQIHAAMPGEPARRQVARVLDHLVTVQHAVTHPRLKLPVCGCSRTYRRFLNGESMEGRCIADAASAGTADSGYQPPPAVLEAYRRRRFPYSVEGRATSVPFRFQSWQEERAALGSMTGGNYFWQQIHCMAAVGDAPDAREIVFMPGAYTVANGYVRQEKRRALCLFTRRVNTFLRTQRFAEEDKIADEFGSFGIGTTDGWIVDHVDSRLILQAYGHKVAIHPFVLDGDSVLPTDLFPQRRTSLGQGRFHRTPADMTEYCFPDGVERFGCLVELAEQGQQSSAADISCRMSGRELTLTEGGGLAVRLFLQPDGSDTELYDVDWRTLPIFECPEHTLWPGEMLRP